MKIMPNDTRRHIKETVLYLMFGMLTTIVSVLSYWVFTRLFLIGYGGANVLSWFAAVTFAYITNKRFVFSDKGNMLKKAVTFYFSRLFTLVVEITVMYLMIEWLLINDLITKVTVQALVILLNYIISKFIVFRKG